MIEVVSSVVMAGVVAYAQMQKAGTSEKGKLQKIFANSGLTVKEATGIKSPQLYRRTKFDGGTEYAYRIPLGLSFESFQAKLSNIRDGLNIKKMIPDISLNDLKKIDPKGNITEQIKSILEQKTLIKKDVEIHYDGMLRIRVYNNPLPTKVEYENNCRGWEIFIGVSRNGIIKHNFDKHPHLIVAGETGYGKTVFLKSTITTLTVNNPDHVTFTLLDLKGGLAFQRFKNLSQVKCVAKNTDESLTALRKIHNEILLTMDTFLNKGYEDIKEANTPYRHFIVIDEGAELASAGTKDEERRIRIECERLISEIARLGRGIGYRLIFATQYPTADTLPRQVKQNASAKVCFHLSTNTASRVVLDEDGAEDIPLIEGRAIYKTVKKHMVQTPFITNEYIDNAIKPYRKEVGHEKKSGERRTNPIVLG